MKILHLLTGHVSYELLQHGKRIEDAIARHDNDLLNHSTPELERYFSRPLSELPRQNAYPVAILLPLFLVIFAFNLLPFLQTISSMSPTLHTLSFFCPIASDTYLPDARECLPCPGIHFRAIRVFSAFHHPADINGTAMASLSDHF